MKRMSLLAAAGVVLLSMTAPSLSATTHHKAHAARVAAPTTFQGANDYALSLGCGAGKPLSEPTYMWLQDRAGGASWPDRPNGWVAGAPCNPRGYK